MLNAAWREGRVQVLGAALGRPGCQGDAPSWEEMKGSNGVVSDSEKHRGVRRSGPLLCARFGRTQRRACGAGEQG